MIKQRLIWRTMNALPDPIRAAI